MREQASTNKVAWEYRAYDFWNRNHGSPAERAAAIQRDPLGRFHFHRKFFENVTGLRIANPCGSNGRMAVPLALLGNDVTVFDLSEENRRYALELAKEAGASIEYVLGDFCDVDLTEYGESFDIVFAEGGIIHYFSDIDAFTQVLFGITKPTGRLILSDFHPYRKINRTGSSMMSVEQTNGDYFDTRLHEADVAYQGFFSQKEQELFPKCQCRFYTMSEIINSIIAAGFTVNEFLEHPSFEDGHIPGYFTVIASR